MAGVPSGPAAADVVAGTIDVGPEASGIAVNPATNTVYVATRDGLAIINGKTHTVAKVATGGVPANLAVNVATNKVYVVNKSSESSGTVAVVDGATHAVLQIPVGPDLTNAKPIAINQKTNKIYVGTNAGVTVITGGTNTTELLAGTESSSKIAVNEVTNKIYVLADGVKTIDGDTNSVTPVDMGSSSASPSDLAVNQATNEVYIASGVRNYMELEVLDGAASKVRMFFNDLNSASSTLTVDEKNNRIYLGRTLLGDGTLASKTGVLSIFDGDRGQLADIGTGRRAPWNIAVNETTNKVYFPSNVRGTTVVDGTTFALSTLSNPAGGDIAVNEATNKIFASDWEGFVTVIDGNSPTPMKNDFNSDRTTDVLARDASGILWLYPGNGTGGWLPRAQVGSAWNSMTAVVSPGDFNGDKKPDVLARDGAGHLWMYPGNGTGGWLPRIHVGSGWNAITAIVTPADFNGDGTADILGRDTSGVLWLYPGDGKGDWLPRTNLGAGWNSLTAIVGPGDFNSDGTPDVLARDGSGVLWLYNGNGTGGWRLDRQKVGEGWNSMTAIIAPGDFNGDGRPDIVARDSAGSLFLYPSAGAGAWLPTLPVGQGWNVMTAIL